MPRPSLVVTCPHCDERDDLPNPREFLVEIPIASVGASDDELLAALRQSIGATEGMLCRECGRWLRFDAPWFVRDEEDDLVIVGFGSGKPDR